VRDQTYGAIVEVVVADGRSSDRTREVAHEFRFVHIVDNPSRIQATGLNRALATARGDIVVRVDGHCVLADDYVQRCVDALVTTGAVVVGGGMTPQPEDPDPTLVQRGIASAMASRLGVGPARFHVGGAAGWVDTVYLGAYRREHALEVGGYAEDLVVNEDSEFAIRMNSLGGVWFDPRIVSVYVPRSTLRSVTRQFYRYGRGRAKTALRHPDAVRPRQLAAPALVLGLLSGRRRTVAAVYAALVVARASCELTKDPAAAPAFACALPLMHVSWGLGFLHGLVASVGGAASRLLRAQPGVDLLESLNPADECADRS